MRPSRLPPLVLSGLVIVASVVALIAIGLVTNVSLHHVFDDLHGGWVVIVVLAEAAGFVPYLIAYRQLAVVTGEKPARLSLLVSTVLAGFGPFAAGGGFSLDRRVFESVYREQATARVQVIGLISLEWAMLAPLVWLAAVILLVEGAHVQGSLPVYWVIGVPLGFAAVLWTLQPSHRLSWLRRSGFLVGVIDGIRVIHLVLRRPLRTAPAWGAMLLYWLLELLALSAAARMFGLHLDVVRITLAYGTGYVVTRRSLPFAGAVVAEVLLTLALHWCGAPLGPALATVAVYRLVNLGLCSVPALLARRSLTRSLGAAAI